MPPPPDSMLAKLYAGGALPHDAWADSSDAAFIGTHLIERSISLAAPQLTGRLIDVGCGQQPYRQYFSHVSEIVACDFDAKRGTVDFTCPADKIPVADASFDSVLCTEVLEHVPDPNAVWQEFFRILKPGGRVLLSTPMYWPAHEEPYDFFRYPRCGLRALAERAGFVVEELWPRGGSWAFLAQVSYHVFGHFLRWKWLRRRWNLAALRMDQWRCNENLSLGWTILARRPSSQDYFISSQS